MTHNRNVLTDDIIIGDVRIIYKLLVTKSHKTIKTEIAQSCGGIIFSIWPHF